MGDGRAQAARHLIETVIQIAGADAGRRRTAWLAYAQLYRRTHDINEALLSALCAQACSAPHTVEEVFCDTMAFALLLRDAGDRAAAMRALSLAEARLAAIGGGAFLSSASNRDSAPIARV